MKIAYLDCHSGISGEMALSALLDAGASLKLARKAIHGLTSGFVEIEIESTLRKGFRGVVTTFTCSQAVNVNRFDSLSALLDRAKLSPSARRMVENVLHRLQMAEAAVDGERQDWKDPNNSNVLKGLACIVGVASAYESLGIEHVVASPVPVGSGLVQTNRGSVSVPTPMTAELLKGIPVAPCGMALEMTNAVGAAILAELTSDFGPIPAIQVNRIGYGAGDQEIPDRPNLLRILIGHSLARVARDKPDEPNWVWVLTAIATDSTDEEIQFVSELAWDQGAIEVTTANVLLGNTRSAKQFSIVCHREDRRRIETLLLEHTNTPEIRVRREEMIEPVTAMTEVNSPWGKVPGSVTKLPSGLVKFSPLHSACFEIARTNSVRLSEVIREAEAAYTPNSDAINSNGVEDRKKAVATKRPRNQPGKVDSAPSVDTRQVEEDTFSIERAHRVNVAFQQAAVEDRENEFGSTSNPAQIAPAYPPIAPRPQSEQVAALSRASDQVIPDRPTDLPTSLTQSVERMASEPQPDLRSILRNNEPAYGQDDDPRSFNPLSAPRKAAESGQARPKETGAVDATQSKDTASLYEAHDVIPVAGDFQHDDLSATGQADLETDLEGEIENETLYRWDSSPWQNPQDPGSR